MYINPFDSGLQVEQKIPFTFTSGVISIQPVQAGALLDSAWVDIQTTFDGGGASVALGTAGNPNLVFAPGDVTPSSANQYSWPSIVIFPIDDALILTIVSGGSTQGSGVLVCRYRGPA